MIGMGRAREAIYATMLAAAISVYGAIEGNVRRLIEADDGAWMFLCNSGAQLNRGTVKKCDMIAPVAVRYGLTQTETL